MKIDNIQGKYLDTKIYKNKEDKEKKIDINKEKSVNIEISSSARELVQKISESQDRSFSERVEKIRQSILEGNYKISSEEIADKILQRVKAEKNEV